MYTQSIGAFAPSLSQFKTAAARARTSPANPSFGPRGFVPPPRAAFTARTGPAHFSPIVRPNPALQQQLFKRNQEAFRQREVARLMQQNRYTREQALIAANAALTTQNASLQAQAAAQAAQQQAPQMPAQAAAPAVSPASPQADLTPQQDAADGGEAAPPTSVEPVPHHKSKLLLFGALAVVAGVGGYVLLKKKRPATAGK